MAGTVFEWNAKTCPRCLLFHGLTLAQIEGTTVDAETMTSAIAHIDDMMCEGQHVN